jgi:ubiquinone/menaquinone biosynthesis C-methylase UbiE
MSDVTRAFDEASQFYEDWYEEPMGAQVYQAELHGLERLLHARGLGVEIGAGTGTFASNLDNEYRVVICLDPSPGMLAKTVRKGLHAVLGMGESMPFREMIFDFAFMVVVIEFLTNPQTVLESVKYNLKPCSPLVTLTINRSSPWGMFYKTLAEKGDPIFAHATFYDMHEIELLLLDACYTLQSSLSTLTNAPTEYNVGVKLIPGTAKAGVVLIKALKKG